MDKDDKEQKNYRQKRVQRIKKIIITIVVILLVLPTIISIFLMVRVFQMQKQLDAYVISQNEDESLETSVAKAAEIKDSDTAAVTSQAINTKETTPTVKKVYLTFDDGPSTQTKGVLDVLKEEGVKASFFVVGHEDRFSKKIYKRIVREGHTLGMHSYSHIYNQVYESIDAFQKDYTKIKDYLTKITGVTPKYYRFPGGSACTSMMLPVSDYASILEGDGTVYIDWNVICGDTGTETLTTQQMVDNVVKGVAQYETSIVRFHDSSEYTNVSEVLKKTIDILKQGGYELLPIDEQTPLIRHAQ